MGDIELQRPAESRDLNLIPQISRPTTDYDYRKFAGLLKSVVRSGGGELRSNDLERFLLRTPDFSSTFIKMQEIINDQIKAGTLRRSEGEALIGKVIYSTSLVFCNAEETNQRLLRGIQQEVKNFPVKNSNKLEVVPPKQQIKSQSEFFALKKEIESLAGPRRLSDRDIDTLINKTTDIDKVLKQSKEIINKAINDKTVSQEVAEAIVGDALETAAREAANPDERAARIIGRVNRDIQKREKLSEDYSKKPESTPTSDVFIKRSNEILEKYGSTIFLNLEKSLKAAEPSEVQYVTAGVSQICIDLASNKDLTAAQKRSAVCTASRSVDKEIGFRTATPRETLDLFKKHLAIELINQRDGIYYPTKQDIENARKIAAQFSPIKVHHTTSAYTVTSTTKTRDIDKEYLQNASIYRNAVEKLLEIGARVQSNPGSYQANKTQLINALNAVSEIPERVIGENIPNMAKGLAHQLTHSYSDDLDLVNKGILGGILKGLNSAYDFKNRMLVFEVYMDKKNAKETANNLLQRINKTISDPGRLDFERDGYIANLRRDNMNRDIDTIVKFLRKNYLKQDYQFNAEIQDLMTLRGNLKNVDALNRVRSFLAGIDRVTRMA